MQNRDGGWGAFDRGCDKEILTLVPFADHNAMIDPSTSDVTARSVEALRLHGYGLDHPAVCAGVAFLHREQEEDGSWYGRWGANYIYGTWLALTALRAAGERATGESPSAVSRRGVDWLLSRQSADGGWGESLLSYEEPSLQGVGDSSASQTAWAMLGLLAATDGEDETVLRAVELGGAYLLRTQEVDGNWHDEHWTGTGFPRVFYLRYHLYCCYFPLQALATLRRVLETRARVGRAA
jgi:squalene-hopene/tetraprenyl-beta-curcumene cyclase